MWQTKLVGKEKGSFQRGASWLFLIQIFHYLSVRFKVNDNFFELESHKGLQFNVVTTTINPFLFRIEGGT